MRDRPAFLRNTRLGLVVHQASVDRELVRTDERFLRDGAFDVAALFGPQHGVYGEKQDDMIESDSFVHPELKIPVYSLYGDVRQPTSDMLADIDTMVFDLQDVGVRVYTFVWTMTLAMEACRDAGKTFVVLDRPNPVGGVQREGEVLDPAFRSFVGGFPVPLRHGLTAGEMARLCNEQFGIGCDLHVVPCEGWNRNMRWPATALPMVMPSPNIPTYDSCTVYPGMVLIEGTNLSEGRGTTRPFELVGAPYLNADRFAAALNAQQLPGVVFRAANFEPTFQKHAQVVCGGVQLHVTDPNTFEPVTAAVAVIATAREQAPNEFAWRDPPYEYEYDRMPIDLLWGTDGLRSTLDGDGDVDGLLSRARAQSEQFGKDVQHILLYGE